MINTYTLKVILKAYLSLLILLSFILGKDLTLLIVLQNTLMFSLISALIFYIFNSFKENKFTYASGVTYLRVIISIILLSIAINSPFNQGIFNKFYLEDYFILLAFISLCFDGIDGYIARKLNEQSNFGELFDQDADTFLILVLCISLYLNKDINLLVFFIPLYRYIFILLSIKYAWVKYKLPESYYRKLSCVVSTCLLIACHSHYIKDISLDYLVLSSLFVITFSFAKDILWLYNRDKYEKI